MLVATESFTDPTDGLPIVAGCTRVAPGAEVAIRFPHRFRPDRERSKSRGIIRGGGSASVTADRPSATPLPTLYEELEPTYRATLGYEAEQTILTDIRWTQENVGDVESGGWLFTAERNPEYILMATVPGSDSDSTRSSINLGFEQLEAAQRLHRDYEVSGCWHFHPGGGDVPSETDLRSFTHGAKLGRGCWFSLIVTPSRSWRPDPEIFGWVTFGPRTDQLITERLKLVT